MPILIGKHKLNKTECSECIVCLSHFYEVNIFHKREADLYNKALVEYGYSIPLLPLWAGKTGKAMTEMLKASHRLVQSSTEIELRMWNLGKFVPDIASNLIVSWLVVMANFKAYAENEYAKWKAIKRGGIHLKTIPQPPYPLKEMYEYCLKETEKDLGEFQRLLLRSGVDNEAILKLMVDSEKAVSDENWQPVPD